MKPPRFEYHAPRALDEALALLARQGDRAKVLAGGQSLIPLLNFRLAHPEALVDINRIGDLAYVRANGDGLAIGALTRQHAVERSETVRARAPILAEACRFIGHLPIRHRGTIGGSLAHADPASELPAVMVALEAQLTARPRAGPAHRARGRVLRRARSPRRSSPASCSSRCGSPTSRGARAAPSWRWRAAPATSPSWAWRRSITLDASGRCERARIALCGVGPTPIRARARRGRAAGRRPRRARRSTRRRAAPPRPRARRPTCTARRTSAGSSPVTSPARPSRWRPSARQGAEHADDRADRPRRQRHPPRAERRAALAPGRRDPRHAGPHRHAHRLRARRLRHLHRAPRRRDRQVLPDAGRRRRRRRDPHGRGPGRRRRPQPAAGGLPRGAGAAVRVLHAGHADDRARAAAREPGAERAGDPRGHLRQPVPLHGLPGHRRGRPPRRRPAAGPPACRRAEETPWPRPSAGGSARTSRASRTRSSSPGAPPTPTT